MQNQFWVVRHRSINEIDPNVWDSLNSDKDLFHSHRFIRSVEDAKVENSQFWYLLFYSNQELVGTAALSAFTVSLETFLGRAIESLVTRIRSRIPAFLRIRVLFCGLPISLGQQNLRIKNPTQANEVISLLVQEMETICSTEKISYLCAKEFVEDQVKVMDGFLDHGFFRGYSIPYVMMKVRWPTFAAYLADLRHGYRRQISQTLLKRKQSEPVLENPLQATSGANPPILLGGAKVCNPAMFFEGYLQVMERAEVKLETLNQPFFENIYNYMDKDTEIVAMRDGNRILGSALLMQSGDSLFFVLVGLDYARRDEFDVYFNLVYAIIALAIQRKCQWLYLGQTSYWLKQRVGGYCVPEYLYFKSRRPFIHRILQLLKSVIFPELKLETPRVFRNSQRE